MGRTETLGEVKVGCALLAVLMPIGLHSMTSGLGVAGRISPWLMAAAGLMVLAMVAVGGMLLIRPRVCEGFYVLALGAAVTAFCATFLDIEAILFPIASGAGGLLVVLLNLMEARMGQESA